MGTWSAFLFAYVLGGVTFIPLVILAVLAHGLHTFPERTDVDKPRVYDSRSDIVQPGDDTEALEAATKSKDEKTRAGNMDVAAGYFAVCREYTPMGINAKPIERSTPVGSTTVAAPSPSVYQTMYRSIFERKAGNAAQGVGENNGVSQRPKKAGNVFYVVLRHGHLMLFDDEEQLEVRHVISLAHHDVSVYSGGDVTPEGELWIKRNALCLSRKSEGAELAPEAHLSKPFYLFSENCSAKEDFYFALLRNKEQTFGAGEAAPSVQQFDVKNIISLVQKLHSSEDNVHSRWLNALIGRVFLGLYKTKDLENFIVEKLTKKISRVKRPSFLTDVVIRNVHIGDAAPMLNNLRLKDLSVEGECVVEADVRYIGNARLEVAATAKIDLGQRFKAREVNLVLAVVLKRIEGHVLLKIKPPPSNRVWFSFQSMPKMEMAVEPIVSSRQITYTVILRQIENRIKEVFAETLVQPFWDDMPFFKTEHKNWRGGIFEGDDALPEKEETLESVVAQAGDVETVDKLEENTPDPLTETKPIEKSHSMPVESQSVASSIFGKKIGKGSSTPSASASVTNLEVKTPTSPIAPRSPKVVTNNTEPVVATDIAHADTFKPSSSPPDHATNYMAAIQSKVQDASPSLAPTSPVKSSSGAQRLSVSSASSGENKMAEDAAEDAGLSAPGRRNTASSADSGDMTDSPNKMNKHSFINQTQNLSRNFFMRRENSNNSLSASNNSDSNSIHSASSQKKNTLAAVTNAAAQARQWGWNAIQRQKDARRNSEASSPVDLSQPMGRGQPLPPPGTPLPGPTNGKTKIGPVPPPASAPKRKPIPSTVPEQEDEGHLQPPPLPGRKRRGGSVVEDEPIIEQMLVVEAPEDSEPSTPADDKFYGADRRATKGATTPGSATHPPLTPSTTHSTLATNPQTHDAASRRTSQTSQTSQPTTPFGGNFKTGDGPVVAVPASAAAEGEEEDDFSGWMDEEVEEKPPQEQQRRNVEDWRTQHDKTAGHELLVP